MRKLFYILFGLLSAFIFTANAHASKPVFYSASPVGTSHDLKTGTPNITISSGVATLSVAQTGNIGAGCKIVYNSTSCFIAPNRIGFDSGGTAEIEIGDKIQGGTSGATGVVRAVHLVSGTWAGGDAAGYIYFEKTSGAFQDNEQINRLKPSSSTDIGTIDGTIQGNIGNGNTEFVVLTATGGTPADQTSTAVTNIYHEYASLSAWEAGFTDSSHLNTTDLTTDNIIAFACCYYDDDDGTTDSTLTTIDFGTTGADGYVYVFTPSGGAESINSQRNAGTFDTTKYFMQISNSYSYQITINEAYTRIDGIQFDINSVSNSRAIRIYAADVQVSSCFFKNCTSNYGTIRNEADGTIIYNCVFYDCYYAILNRDYYHFSLYNSTIEGCTNGIENQDTHDNGSVIANCAIFNNTDDVNGAAGLTISYCASDDGDGTNAVDWDNESTDWANVFTDYTNNDYSLKNYTSTGAIIDQGTDLSSNNIWRDVIGTERGATWDIGAFEYATSGWGGKVYGISPSKVEGVDTDNISKICGVE